MIQEEFFLLRNAQSSQHVQLSFRHLSTLHFPIWLLQGTEECPGKSRRIPGLVEPTKVVVTGPEVVLFTTLLPLVVVHNEAPSPRRAVALKVTPLPTSVSAEHVRQSIKLEFAAEALDPNDRASKKTSLGQPIRDHV